jgi:hypothetical protein
VSHCGLAIHIKKYLNAKDELWKLKYFIMQKYNLKKKSSKRNQNPSRYHNSKTNLKFQHASKYPSFKKNPHIKIDILLPRGQNPLIYYYILYNESKHNILALVVGKANNKLPSLVHRLSGSILTTLSFYNFVSWVFSSTHLFHFMVQNPSLFPFFHLPYEFPWCVDSLSLWRRNEESKKDINKTQHNTKYTHTNTPPFASSLHKFL